MFREDMKILISKNDTLISLHYEFLIFIKNKNTKFESKKYQLIAIDSDKLFIRVYIYDFIISITNSIVSKYISKRFLNILS